MNTAILVHAESGGIRHPLDTRERMLAWFGAEPRAADYFVTYAGKTHAFDGNAWNAPRSPSHLVMLALSRIPGNAPRANRADWSLLDDFTRGHCATLASALRQRLGGEPMVCAFDTDPFSWETDPEENDWTPGEPSDAFGVVGLKRLDDWRHVGILIGDQVYCAQGRQDPHLWAYETVRSDDSTLCARITPETLDRLLPVDVPQAVLDTVEDVVDLVAMLVSDDDEPCHAEPVRMAA